MWYSSIGRAHRRAGQNIHNKGTKGSCLRAFVCLLVHPVWGWAQETSLQQSLALDAALRAAESRSHALISQGALAVSSREKAVAARQLPDPVLSLSLDNVTVDGEERWSWRSEPMTMGTIGLMQTLIREDKRMARGERFEQEARLAEVRELVQLVGLRRETALAWLERYYRGQIVALLQQQRIENARLVDVTEAAYGSGLNLQADVLLARSELAKIDDLILEAEASLRLAEIKLTRWTGIDSSTPLGVLPAISTIHLQTTDIERELLQQPELLVLASQVAAAEIDVDLAELDKRGDWNIELRFSQRSSGFGNMVSLGVSRPLQIGQSNKQERELSARLAQAESTRSEYVELMREYLAQVQTWLSNWRKNQERLVGYNSTLVPLAEDRTVATLNEYQSNKVPLTAVFAARQAEIEVRLARLRLEMETAALWARLEFLMPPDNAELEAGTAIDTRER